MSFRLAVISDIHFGKECPIPERKGQFGAVFLLRAVHRLKRFLAPDAVVVLGDCINSAADADALHRLGELKKILDLLPCPVMVLPGNHDPVASDFYTVFSRPDDHVDWKGIRFLPFLDAEEPGFHARRSERDLARLAAAGDGFEGPLVTLQHVPVLPRGETGCPYSFTNLEEVLDASRRAGISLHVGGHFHAGTDLVGEGDHAFIGVPALSDDPYCFTMIEIEYTPGRRRAETRVERHPLAMPRELELMDTHCHTPFAYCQENMDMVMAPDLAMTLGLALQGFAEHSGQLYFDQETFWGARFCDQGIDCVQGRKDRSHDYWREMERTLPMARLPALAGLEVDVDFRGELVMTREDLRRAKFLNGAIHFLPEMLKPKPQMDGNLLTRQFLEILNRLLDSGVHILAHPFRILRKQGVELPRASFKDIVRRMRQRKVAAEINFHTNEPDAEFVRLCLEGGVKLALGTDAHNLYEVGEFWPHLRFLREAGCRDGDLKDALVCWDGERIG
ncbi:MAG: metallophosphoesterase [Verrucomicrobiae bacterium]|nr:metallophosphoesterase [Verrucomicrobiae bacterium]